MKLQVHGLLFLVTSLLLVTTGQTEVRAQQLTPAIAFVPNSVDFGMLDGCSSFAERTVHLVNVGSTGVDIDLSDTDAGPFLLSASNSIISLGPGDSVEVFVRFAPASPGNYSDTLRVADITGNATATLHVSGGLESVGYSLSPGTLDLHLPDWTDGQTVDTSFTFRNHGTGNLTVTDAITYAPFSTTSPALPLTVGPGEEVTIGVRFSPDREGEWTSSLTIIAAYGSCADSIRSRLLSSAGTGAAVPADTKAIRHSWGRIGSPQPNPAVNQVIIPLELYRSDDVILEVLDIAGRRVEVLQEGTLQAGLHHIEWQPDLPGYYTIRLIREGMTVTRSVIVHQ